MASAHLKQRQQERNPQWHASFSKALSLEGFITSQVAPLIGDHVSKYMSQSVNPPQSSSQGTCSRNYPSFRNGTFTDDPGVIFCPPFLTLRDFIHLLSTWWRGNSTVLFWLTCMWNVPHVLYMPYLNRLEIILNGIITSPAFWLACRMRSDMGFRVVSTQGNFGVLEHCRFSD